MKYVNALSIPLSIVEWPHPALTTVSAPVTVFDAELRWLVSEMKRLCLEHRGLGLSANQVGRCVRVFVARGVHGGGGVQAYVNPRIVERIGPVVSRREGCLSWPAGGEVFVARHRYVRMAFQTLRGEAMEQPASEMIARCWQHEIDHLDGVNLANPRKAGGP